MSAQHGSRERYRQHIVERSEPCAPCRDSERVEKAAYRARVYLNRGPLLVDGTGTRRRIQALTAIGWPAAEIAARIGCNRTNVSKWAKQQRVHSTTAGTVRAIYDELSMQPGPSTVARRVARQNGWRPPLCWDDETIDDPKVRPRLGSRRGADPVDEIAIERAMAGDDVHLTPSERAEAARRLTARGLSAAEVADRLNTTTRSVVRYRTAAA